MPFLEAERHFHAPTVLIYRARAFEKLGWLLQAKSSYQEILNEQFIGTVPREFRAAQEEARGELEELSPRIPSLQIFVRGAAMADLHIVLDRYPVRGPSLKRPILLNPGEHHITLSAPDRDPERRTVVLAEQDRKQIVFDLGAPPREREPAASRPIAAPVEASPADASPAEGSLVPAAIAFTVGVAGLGIGAMSGVLALGSSSELEDRCPDRRCGGGSVEDLREAESLRTSAQTLGTLSTVTFIAGGAATAAGVVLALVRPGGGRPAQVGLGAGPGWISVRGSF